MAPTLERAGTRGVASGTAARPHTRPGRTAARPAPRPRRDWRPQFLATLAQGAPVVLAARSAGISRAAAYKARARAPHFAEAWDTAIEDAIDMVELVAYWMSVSGDYPEMTRWLLERRRPEEWSKKGADARVRQ